MPKRKYVSIKDYEQLVKKLRKIEEEVKKKPKNRRRRRRILSSSSSETDDSSSVSRSQRNDRQQPISQADSPPVPAAPASPLVASSASLETPGSPPAAAAQEEHDALPATMTSSTEDAEVLDLIPDLDAEVLEILGVDPSKTDNFGKEIQKDVAVRFEYTATNGLTKEDRAELTKKYLIPENCKLVGAPTLNPELKAALSESVIKRDGVIESKQKLMASGLSSLGAAITFLLSSKDKNNELLRLLIDAGKIFCDCQHHETNVRRNFITFSVKKEMKESLQNTKVDSFLFSQDLPETLKVAKAINKQGSELKPAAPKPSTSKANFPSSSKNWKGQARPGRAQPTNSKTTTSKTTASSTTKDQRGASSRKSQSHRASRSRR